jgi:hypothetical protein
MAFDLVGRNIYFDFCFSNADLIETKETATINKFSFNMVKVI